jgi:hypothetical protein
MTFKLSPKAALLGCLAAASSLIAVLFSGENRDYVADKMLLNRSYEHWLPVWAPDLGGMYYTNGHPQEVVDSYGYTFHYISHLVSRLVAWLFGEDFRNLGSTSVMTQNALVAILGVLGCWAVGLVCREVLQSRRAEFVGILGTFFLPLWLGHSWMNQKDIPFAVGFACATAVATLAVHLPRGEKATLTQKRELAVTAFFALSLTFGTRPGLSIMILPLLAFAGWHVYRRAAEMLKPLSIAVYGAIALVLLTNPASIPNPIGWAWNGVVIGRDFTGYNGDVLFDGSLIRSTKLGWWYLFKSLISSMPLVAILGMAAGAIFMISLAMRGRLSKIIPVTYHAVVVAVVVLGLSSNNYNVGRQYMFIVLGWQMVAISGLWWMVTLSNRYLRTASQISVLILAGYLVVDNVSIFPYQYVYRNEIARRADNFAESAEFDYWGMAGRDLVSAIPNEPNLDIYFGAGDWLSNGGKYTSQSGQPFVPSGSTILEEKELLKSDEGKVNIDYVPWLHYWPPSMDHWFRGPLDNCKIVDSAYAVMPPERVLLGSLYKCR